MTTSLYNFSCSKITKKGLCAAFVSDLHNCRKNAQRALESLERKKPHFILFSGDAVNRISGKYADSLDFLESASKIAPLFYSMGNHELIDGFEAFPNEAKKRGATVLDNEYTCFEGIYIGGMSFICEWEDDKVRQKRESFLAEFSALDGCKLLMSHVPAYYTQFLNTYDIDLILSGHSHGGQIGFGKRGIYAPDQGFFPKYVGGFYENRLIVTRGLGQTAPLPRFFNPYEIVYISFN